MSRTKRDAEPSTKKPLKVLFSSKIASSGLDEKDARKLGFKLVPSVGSLGAWPAGGGFQIPYFDLKGKPTKFWRARYLEAPVRNGFDAQTEKKELRYVQVPDLLSEAYFPPLINWERVAGDTKVPITVTEGELKAAAGCKYAEPTIGLGGVWMFKSAKFGVPFLPALEAIQWSGRPVRVAFDSDALSNPDVMKALNLFCAELSARGAHPSVVRIPPLTKDGKTGLDDYVVECGSKALKELLDTAEPFGPVAELLRVNTEVAYVKNPGIVVVLEDGRKLTPGAFKDHAYANRHYYEEVAGKNGPSVVKRPVAPAWLTWEQRHELERLTYRPGESRIVEGEYNYWRGWACEPKKGDAKRWAALLDYLFRGDKPARAWFEQWCAYPIQHPGAKLFSAAVLWGSKHGTGKTLVGHALMAIYGDNAAEIEDQHLQSPYNEWAENKQFVLGDEITSNEQSGAQKRAMADRLKGMITRKRLRLNPKYVPSFEVPDCINYYLTSNHPDVIFLEDSDRRYFVWEVDTTPLERAFYEDFCDWLYKRGGAAELFHHLLHVDLEGFDPHGPAHLTTAKEVMQESSLSELGAWVRKLAREPELVLKLGEVPLNGDLFAAIDLLQLFDPEQKGRYTVAAMGRELKRAGFKMASGGKTIRTALGQARLYAVRNAAKWAAPNVASGACAEHYAAARGVSKPKHAGPPKPEPVGKVAKRKEERRAFWRQK